MTERFLTRQELAAYCGCSRQALDKREKHHTLPPADAMAGGRPLWSLETAEKLKTEIKANKEAQTKRP
jgi:predicted DNA-binding transcriptional regulator AlpA